MPAEWAPHTRCWMAWPCRAELWRGRITAARAAYAEVAKAIARFEPVTMVVRLGDAAGARDALGSRIPLLELPLSDSWMRDTGPTFLINKQGALAGAAWQFNGWGGKYRDYGDDARLATRLLVHLGLPCFPAPFVLEGGAIHVDGEGTALVTEQCLMNPNRNPALKRADVEAHLQDWLGVKTVIWLGQGLIDDETDGHVDNLACFARPGVVLALSEDDYLEPNFPALSDNLERLRKAKDAQGRDLTVIAIPQPAAREADGKRMALSYINFYRANGGLVVPRFEDSRDAVAQAAFAQVFPELKIASVAALDIVRGGGGIHCITQQQPRGA
ncbi:MAG: agmatine deiminase family protein [Proteobacteria bacterium]|nr:agmatine deiminase family protein [Pseudomonadota bacterium]